MAERDKGFLNQNRFKSSKAIKRTVKHSVGTGGRGNKTLNKSRLDKSMKYGGR